MEWQKRTNGMRQAADLGNKAASEKYALKAASYDSDSVTGQGKNELMAKARALETLLTASILSVNNRMLLSSMVVGALGALLMSQARWLWLPIVP